MKTLDLSISHVGKTVRIERDNIVGTHNYIEGILGRFDFLTDTVERVGATQPLRVYPDIITAEIAGYTIELTGQERLTVINE